jgi:hypothetical protein
MNDDEVRTMIGTALENEPPIGIDYGTVRAAGRRRVVRRNTGIAGAAALAVAGVAGLAVTVGQLSVGLGQEPAAGPISAPTSTEASRLMPAEGCVVPAMSGGFGDIPDGQASDEELAESARLTEAFGRFAFPPLPPGVTMDPDKPRLCAIQESWGTNFTLRTPDGEREVLLEVKPRAGQAPGECRTLDGSVRCAITRAPDGSQVRISDTPPPERTQPRLVDVTAWRPDGTIVRILETGSEDPTPAPRVLDDHALIAIATAPELRVDWETPAPPVPAEPSDRRAAELTDRVIRLLRWPGGILITRLPDARVEPLTFYVSQGGYKLEAAVEHATGTGHLFVNLNPPVPGAPPVSCADQPNCEPIELPDGRQAVTARQTENGVTTWTVNAVATDGTQIHVALTNRPKATGQPDPPVVLDFLIMLAGHPELRW